MRFSEIWIVRRRAGKNVILAGCLACGLVGPAFGQNQAPSQFPTSPPVPGKVVVEDEYQFTLRRYSPPVRVNPITSKAASYATPELATIAAISAMLAGDLDWYNSTFDAASQRSMEQRDKELNRGPEYWVQVWRKSLGGKVAELTARIETGDYVIVVYRFSSQDKPEGPPAPIEVFTPWKLQDGRWVATQELANDPVMINWRTPDVRLRRIIRRSPPQ